MVESGKPPEVLRWRKDGTIVKHGGPSKLVYTFVPDKTDHKSVYSCEVQNIVMKMPLTKEIHLDIQCENILFNLSSSYNFLNSNLNI